MGTTMDMSTSGQQVVLTTSRPNMGATTGLTTVVMNITVDVVQFHLDGDITQLNETSIKILILQALGLPLSDLPYIGLIYNKQRDFSLGVYFLGPQGSTRAQQLYTALSTNPTVIPGYTASGVTSPKSQTVTANVPVALSMTTQLITSTSGSLPTTSSIGEPIMDSSSSGLTQADIIVIAVVVPVAFIIIVAIIVIVIVRRRGSKSERNEDIEMQRTVDAKAKLATQQKSTTTQQPSVPVKKPADDSSSGSDSESQTSSSTRSSRSSSASSTTSSSSRSRSGSATTASSSKRSSSSSSTDSESD